MTKHFDGRSFAHNVPMRGLSLRVLVACEYSGTVRDAFRALGHDAMSCDLLPSERPGPHHQGDVLDVVGDGWDLMIAHPPCTYLTHAAAWAYSDPDFVRYPGVGYHQRVDESTLTGAARRSAREEAVEFVRRLWAAPVPRKVVENPVSALSQLWRPPTQTIQPHWFGDDASKATCLWLEGVHPLEPTLHVPGRRVERNGKVYERWGNQTDSGQNRLSPGADRWKDRSRTFQGIADAMAAQWGGLVV